MLKNLKHYWTTVILIIAHNFPVVREQTVNPIQDEAHKNAHYRQLNFMTSLHLAQKQTKLLG